MTISRKNAQLAQTINVNSTAIGDTISIPSSGIVNISGVLNVSGVQVSVSGHPHVSTDISDWAEAVQDVVGASGFLVGQSGISISYSDGSNTLTITGSGGGATISNAGDNRILTSDGTSTGINGESNLTFDGTNLNATGVFNIDNLRMDGNTLSSTDSNGNIVLAPNGTGDVQVDADTLRVGDSNSAATITTNGTGNLTLNTNSGSTTGSIVINQGSNGNITISTNGTGKVGINTASPSYNLDVNASTSNSIIRVGPRTIMENVVSNQSMFGRNAIYDGTWKPIATAGCTAIRMHDDWGDASIGFYTHPSASAGSNIGSAWDSTSIKMVIRNGGNIGMGTTSPSYKLHVVGDFATDNIKIDGNAITSTNTNGDIELSPNGTGKVGIGTGSPSYKLDVVGGGKFSQLYPTVVNGSIVAGAVDTDITSGQIFNITLTENITLNNPSNSVDGVTIRWRIQQDGTGGRTVTLGDKFVIPTSASDPLPWSTGVNTMDMLAATYHSGRDKWDIVSFVPGY